MPGDDAATDRLEHFQGIARLFPLPNLVLFPRVVQPLHIFEPRYRAMVEDSLAGDRLIAMALLSPGWEPDYQGRPPVEDIVCLGRIIAHTRMDDGRFNLLLRGLSRGRLVEELPPAEPFRQGRLQLLADEYPAGGAAGREALKQRLVDGLGRLLRRHPTAGEQTDQLLRPESDLGPLTDVLAATLPLSVSQRQSLLALTDVDARAAWLVRKLDELLEQPSTGRRPFPPEFGAN